MLDELIRTGQKEVQLIIFKLGGEEYAVPIGYVSEIIMPQKATRIPKTPHYIDGFINLRGNIIPVIDCKKKFSLKSDKNSKIADKRIMILEVENETIGLIVDSVNEVVSLDVKDIEPPPIDAEDNSEIFWGIGKLDGRLLILINSEKFTAINDEECRKKEFEIMSKAVKEAEKEAAGV